MGNKFKVKPMGITLLLWGVVVLVLMNLLSRFGIVDLTGFQPEIITLLAIFFVAVEIGVMEWIQGKKKLDAFRMFGAIVVLIAFISLLLGWFGMSLAFLNPFKGFVDLALLVFVVVEIFR